MKRLFFTASLCLISLPTWASLTELACVWTIGDPRVPSNNGRNQISLGSGKAEVMDLFVIGGNTYRVSAITYNAAPGIELMSGQKDKNGSYLANTMTFFDVQGDLRLIDNPKSLVLNCSLK